MPHTIRFELDGTTAGLTEELRFGVTAEIEKQKRSKRNALLGLMFGLLYAPPAVVFFSTQEPSLGALVAYLIAAPWLILALPVYLSLRRTRKTRAVGPTEYELELSEAILHIRCGNLSSSVLRNGMKAVERRGMHLMLTFENLAVFLIPLAAFSSEEEIGRWLSDLRGLCAAEASSNRTTEPTL